MKVWTIQPWSVWLYLKKHRNFLANVNHSRNIYSKGHKLDTDFLNAYHWMVKQMAKKISPPPKNITMPIWCWYAQDPYSRPTYIDYPNQVCIELEIPSYQILLSDFDL